MITEMDALEKYLQEKRAAKISNETQIQPGIKSFYFKCFKKNYKAILKQVNYIH